MFGFGGCELFVQKVSKVQLVQNVGISFRKNILNYLNVFNLLNKFSVYATSLKGDIAEKNKRFQRLNMFKTLEFHSEKTF
jgi:hypothetical protein